MEDWERKTCEALLSNAVQRFLAWMVDGICFTLHFRVGSCKV